MNASDASAVSLPRAACSPFRLGRWELPIPVQQAALSGYSDRPMRIMARRMGAPYTLCEVMLEQFVRDLKNRERTRHFLFVGDDDHPVGGQLMGDDPAGFAPAAKKLAAAGFDVIDLNFACPAKRNRSGHCRGGLLLTQPATALEIVERVRAAVPPEIPVTVKMRRAFDESFESRDNFWTICEGAIARGVALVTVHGRTVEQRYVGPSSWPALTEVKQRLGERPMFGSGDLFSAEACLAMFAQTGVDGVSVARGAIGNPWIFRDLRAVLAGEPVPAPPTVAEQGDVLAEHFALAAEVYGEATAVKAMRKHSIKYARLHPNEEAVRNAFAQARSPAEWHDVLRRHYRFGV